MTSSASSHGRTEDEPGETSHRVSPPGVVAGAVLRAARLSAGLSETLLAAAADVSEATIRSWEDGSQPMASVPAPQTERLEAALMAGGADPRLVTDLDAAAWCDLVILAIAGSEDAGCLLADPLAREDAFCELLAWAITGRPPARHRPYAAPGPLLQAADLIAGATQAMNAVPPQPEAAWRLSC